MSRDDPKLPPELQEALEQASSDDGRASDLEDMWALLDGAAPADEALPDADDTWAAVRDHIEDEETDEATRRAADRSSRRVHRPSERWGWRWGSAVAVAVVLAVATWWWTQPVEVAAVPGTTIAHTLPDGSTVELYGDTRLTYPRTFATIPFLEAEQRVVQIRGEAYFEVESGERPFVVQTPSVRVEVVGTAFSVRSRPGETNDAHVALAEGRLRVTDRAASRTTLTLRPGQAATLHPDGTLAAVRDTSLERITAWRRGGFAVTDRPLPALAQALERRFGASVRLSASIAPEARTAPMTLYYSEDADLETILHDVALARGLTYRSTAQGYVLVRADDRPSPQSP
jgi:ferric-dicitrate binding protein FerR (iron transport regulator)